MIGMDPYFSVAIPFTRNAPTQWHPTSPTGAFQTLVRGAFQSKEQAHAWARKHLEAHHEYDVVCFG